MSLINCGQSYTQDISGCAASLIFQFPTLTVDTEYVVKFTYSNGWVLKKTTTSNAYDATITIDNDGYWNIGTGIVLIEICTNDNACTPQTLTVCANNFTSLTLNFINITTDATDAIIPCDCPE